VIIGKHLFHVFYKSILTLAIAYVEKKRHNCIIFGKKYGLNYIKVLFFSKNEEKCMNSIYLNKR